MLNMSPIPLDSTGGMGGNSPISIATIAFVTG